MSITLDFSITSPLIQAYFKGDDSYPPISELMYVHSHPLITPNFLTDIERLILKTAECMVERNYKNGPQNRFVQLTQNLGKQLPILSESNAAEVLKALRDIYLFCVKIIGK